MLTRVVLLSSVVYFACGSHRQQAVMAPHYHEGVIYPIAHGSPIAAPPSGLEQTRGAAQVCGSGSSCSWECPGGGCNYLCEDGATCNIECPGGNCNVECRDAATCNTECDGGNCVASCGDGATCNVECDGGSCSHQCGDGATCNLECDGGGCNGFAQTPGVGRVEHGRSHGGSPGDCGSDDDDDDDNDDDDDDDDDDEHGHVKPQIRVHVRHR